ncbi:hypothetical protein CVT26_001796 [Gymnopilus dilepis]|uniref:Uncharacterized protein n=1 Tax=Gymnopilus dilepis TaxID=231916 RepID=A0A409Y435_9AGAR|nr:hypothetical protein CVT26_001796 [Gymnopilus dilepis]
MSQYNVGLGFISEHCRLKSPVSYAFSVGKAAKLAAFLRLAAQATPSYVRLAVDDRESPFRYYTVPGRNIGSSRSGMNTGPTIFLSVYYQETKHSESAVCLLEGLLDGLYRSKESELLRLTLPFNDLAERNESQILQGFQNFCCMSCLDSLRFQLNPEFRSRPTCRFVLLLQTHADNLSGDLFYGPGKVTSLDVILEKIIGSTPVVEYTNSILLLNSCGFFIEKNRNCLQGVSSKYGFQTILSLTGKSIDPLLVSRSLFYPVIDFHLIGGESMQKVLKRAADVELLSHTSVIAWLGGTVFSLVGASIRHRPNGTPILCSQCNQPADFQSRSDRGDVVKFRCRQSTHDPVTLVGGTPAE